jgi:hypothetical protein
MSLNETFESILKESSGEYEMECDFINKLNAYINMYDECRCSFPKMVMAVKLAVDAVQKQLSEN